MNYQSDTRALPALAITLIALSLSMPSPASAQQAGGTRIGGVLKPDP